MKILNGVILSGDERERYHNHPRKIPEEAKELENTFPQRKAIIPKRIAEKGST